MPVPLLIIANSSRMLAQTAYSEGFIPLAIDLYADTDTQHYVETCWQISSLDRANLVPAVEFLLSHSPVTQVIYGSGFETFPESLAYLQQRLTLCGNTPETFANVIDKKSFFEILKKLDIPYPESVFTVPKHGNNWLSKPLQGQGGNGIQFWQEDGKAVNSYWQKHQSGTPHSVLFLADGQNVRVLGFNRQWTVSDGEQAFLFAGVINQTELHEKQKMAISRWLEKLVPVFGLKGLNSLDFMKEGEDLSVLEINPRPSASMQLYPGDLLTWHINACTGRLPVSIAPPIQASAYQIVYAPNDLRIPATMEWPKQCADVPATDAICRKGQPICSIIAHHKTAQTVCEQLQYLQQVIFGQLDVILPKLPD